MASHQAGERPESDYVEWVCEAYVDDEVVRCRWGGGVVPREFGGGSFLLVLELGMCWVEHWESGV